MAYESRTIRRQKVRYDSLNSDNPLRFQLVVDAAKVTPTSATITIYAPGNTTALVTAAAMSVSGSVLTYSVDTTTEASWPLDNGYRADIAVTVDATVHTAHIVFDVVHYVLNLGIGRDQLIARDARLQAMDWNGDEDLSEIIESARDEIQMMLETRALDDGQLIENMILDQSRIAIPARLYILSLIFAGKGDRGESDVYRKDFDEMFRAMLSGITYDSAQGGTESDSQGSFVQIRLVM